jgi:peptide deformylase
MAKVPVVTVPNTILTSKCAKVEKNDPELKKLVADLIDTLDAAEKPQGAGLSAPQIGVLKRVLIARNFFEDPADPNKTAFENIVFVNPKIISHSKETDLDWEGCLSIPNTWGMVQRYKTIKVRTESVDGEELLIKASGFFARLVQHEMDHLDGILFTTKIVGKTLTENELDALLEKEEVMTA